MMRWLLPLLLLIGCRDTYVLPIAGEANARPLAQAGVGSTVVFGSTVELDGSGSFDPDGVLVAYTWKLLGRPTGSGAVLSAATESSSSFVVDLVGTYTVELSVRDDAGAIGVDHVTFEVAAVVGSVTVDAGPDTTIGWFERGQVTGMVLGSDGTTPTVTWTMTARPVYSQATLVNATTLTPSFIADAQGTYTLQITASVNGQTATDVVDVSASTVGQHFGAPGFAEPVAVEYSAALDRLIVLRRGDPVTVAVIDPATGLGPTVVLPDQFSQLPSFALHPSGLRAAFGIPGEIAIVNLQTLSVEQVFAVVSVNYRLVFAPDNRVHSIPYNGAENIVTLNVATGAITEAELFSHTQGAVMHPSGAAMYVIDSGPFTSPIGRYDIASTPVAFQRQVSLASITPPLHITSDGASLITGDGTVLHSSTSAATDMTIRGSLMTPDVESVTHSSITHEIATVSLPLGANPRRLSWFNDATFARRFSAAFVNPTTLDGYWGGHIYYRVDGQRMYIVGRASDEWTVFTVNPPP